jgi:sarcosine oxidase, subunit alpha
MPRLDPISDQIFFELDGETCEAQRHENVAAALLARDEIIFSRSLKYHRPRGPFCFTGSCLMRVNGVPNIPICRVRVEPGMALERQNVLPDARFDMLRVNDFVFRTWFNHHEFMAGIPVVERVMLHIARKLAGLGLLPDKASPMIPSAKVERHHTVIVGAGAAGLAVAARLQDRKHPFLLLERDAMCGGRLLTEAAAGLPNEIPKGLARTNTEVVGLYEDTAGQPFLVAVQNGLVQLIFFEKLVLANGGYPTLLSFKNNDLAGVMAGRAVSQLIRVHRVLPGETVACVGEADEARALAKLVEQAGGKAVAVGAQPVKGHGRKWIESLTVVSGTQESTVSCDIVALCAPPSPALELARAAGAHTAWRSSAGCFVVEADPMNGKTARPHVFVVGELRGPMSAAAASDQGIACAEYLLGATP